MRRPTANQLLLLLQRLESLGVGQRAQDQIRAFLQVLAADEGERLSPEQVAFRVMRPQQKQNVMEAERTVQSFAKAHMSRARERLAGISDQQFEAAIRAEMLARGIDPDAESE